MNTSTKLQAVDLDQFPPADVPRQESDAIFSRGPMNVDVPIEKILACRTPGEAFKVACWASGLDDKEIYEEVGIDPGYFTNIKKGAATLKADKEALFCKIVGNTVYPQWRALQLGQRLLPIARLEELLAAERKAKELELRLDTAMQMIGRTRSA